MEKSQIIKLGSESIIPYLIIIIFNISINNSALSADCKTGVVKAEGQAVLLQQNVTL